MGYSGVEGNALNPDPEITANPEKPMETIRDEEEAMASVFLNEPDARIREGQGTRTLSPQSDKRREEPEVQPPQ